MLLSDSCLCSKATHQHCLHIRRCSTQLHRGQYSNRQAQVFGSSALDKRHNSQPMVSETISEEGVGTHSDLDLRFLDFSSSQIWLALLPLFSSFLPRPLSRTLYLPLPCLLLLLLTLG